MTGDERAAVLGLLQYQRESFAEKLDGLPEDRARWSPVDSGTSPLWLARHMARAEIVWILIRFAGEPLEIPDDTPADGDTLEAAVADYRALWPRIDAVIAAADLDDRCASPDRGGAVDLRWILLHLIEETARHAGHADIVAEMIDGRTGR